MKWQNFADWLMPWRRASLENPASNLADPDVWLSDIFGGGKTSSGVRMTREAALSWSALWRGVHVVADTVAKLPLQVLKRRTPVGKEPDKGHPAFPVLRHNANEDTNAFTFKQTMQAHAMLSGNGYAFILRDGSFAPMELIQLDPLRVYWERRGGVLVYFLMIEGEAKPKLIFPESMLHIKGMGLDGITGIDVVRIGRESLGLPLAMQEFAARFFRNDGRPSIAIEIEGKPDETEITRLRKRWESHHANLENAHRPAILTGGMKVNPFSQGAKESQLVESRKFSLVDAANWAGVPVHKVGGEGRTAFASLEAENRSFLDDSIEPHLINWEEECRTKLLTEEEKRSDSHVIAFKRDALLAADVQTTSNVLLAQVNGGVLSADEARAVKDLPPLPDGDGARIRMPKSIGFLDEPEPEPVAPGLPAVDDEPDDDDPEEDTDDEDRKTRDMARQVAHTGARGALARMCRRLSFAAVKAAKSPRTFDKWLDTAEGEHSEQVVGALANPLATLCLSYGRRETIDRTNKTVKMVFARWHAILDKLAESVNCDEFPDAVAAAMRGYETQAPDAILASVLSLIERRDDEN